MGAAFDRLLVYATGGYSYLDADAVIRNEPAEPEISTSFDGWNVGGGLEFLVSPSWSMRIEYRYTDYSLTTEDYTVVRSYTLGFEPDIHAVRAGASWYF